MLMEYYQEALNHAQYEIIEDDLLYYGEIPQLLGVWASGNSLEKCRRNLACALDDWLLISIAKGFAVNTMPSMQESTKLDINHVGKENARL